MDEEAKEAVKEAVQAVIDYFKTQKAAGDIVGIRQATVSHYLNGKLSVPMETAFEWQKATNGEVSAKRLCPQLNEYIDTP